MKKLLALVLIGCLAVAGGARAQYLTGTLTGDADSNTPLNNREASASSMELSWSNVVQTTSGSFVGNIPDNSIAMTYYHEIDGLSTTPTTVSINPFFTFLTAVSPGRFSFDLGTLTEDSYDSGTGQALFTGTGTIIDRTGAFENTPGDLTVTFTSPEAYTFSLEAVPEPATMSLAAAGLLGLSALRRQRG